MLYNRLKTSFEEHSFKGTTQYYSLMDIRSGTLGYIFPHTVILG